MTRKNTKPLPKDGVLTCNGCSRPLPGSKGTAAWLNMGLKCRECVKREVAAMQASNARVG